MEKVVHSKQTNIIDSANLILLSFINITREYK